MRKGLAMAAAAGGVLVAIGTGVTPASAGVTGPAFYVDGQQYRTVLTPTNLEGTGAPSHTWDHLYVFPGEQQAGVATAAPGDRDYNGGRWQVRELTFPEGYDEALASGDSNDNGKLDSFYELSMALDDGTAVAGPVVKSFVCPVIKLPKGGRA
jgi:hypothetical protein